MGIKLAPKKTTPVAGTVNVKQEKVDNKNKTTLAESETAETVEIPGDVAEPVVTGEVATTPCVVSMELAFTKNLGNFQSAKFTVGISIPCKHDEVDPVYEYAKEWVDERLTNLVSESE